mmetsp:Transcript_25114/g.78858  ORF Transcript_25114/g.78858 Transcript_25114/m.78858 type:complete len:967 (-) Transcript_25114:199-3099(-)
MFGSLLRLLTLLLLPGLLGCLPFLLLLLGLLPGRLLPALLLLSGNLFICRLPEVDVVFVLQADCLCALLQVQQLVAEPGAHPLEVQSEALAGQAHGSSQTALLYHLHRGLLAARLAVRQMKEPCSKVLLLLRFDLLLLLLSVLPLRLLQSGTPLRLDFQPLLLFPFRFLSGFLVGPSLCLFARFNPGPLFDQLPLDFLLCFPPPLLNLVLPSLLGLFRLLLGLHPGLFRPVVLRRRALHKLERVQVSESEILKCGRENERVALLFKMHLLGQQLRTGASHYQDAPQLGPGSGHDLKGVANRRPDVDVDVVFIWLRAVVQRLVGFCLQRLHLLLLLLGPELCLLLFLQKCLVVSLPLLHLLPRLLLRRLPLPEEGLEGLFAHQLLVLLLGLLPGSLLGFPLLLGRLRVLLCPPDRLRLRLPLRLLLGLARGLCLQARGLHSLLRSLVLCPPAGLHLRRLLHQLLLGQLLCLPLCFLLFLLFGLLLLLPFGLLFGLLGSLLPLLAGHGRGTACCDVSDGGPELLVVQRATPVSVILLHLLRCDERRGAAIVLRPLLFELLLRLHAQGPQHGFGHYIEACGVQAPRDDEPLHCPGLHLQLPQRLPATHKACEAFAKDFGIPVRDADERKVHLKVRPAHAVHQPQGRHPYAVEALRTLRAARVAAVAALGQRGAPPGAAEGQRDHELHGAGGALGGGVRELLHAGHELLEVYVAAAAQGLAGAGGRQAREDDLRLLLLDCLECLCQLRLVIGAASGWPVLCADLPSLQLLDLRTSLLGLLVELVPRDDTIAVAVQGFKRRGVGLPAPLELGLGAAADVGHHVGELVPALPLAVLLLLLLLPPLLQRRLLDSVVQPRRLQLGGLRRVHGRLRRLPQLPHGPVDDVPPGVRRPAVKHESEVGCGKAGGTGVAQQLPGHGIHLPEGRSHLCKVNVVGIGRSACAQDAAAHKLHAAVNGGHRNLGRAARKEGHR